MRRALRAGLDELAAHIGVLIGLLMLGLVTPALALWIGPAFAASAIIAFFFGFATTYSDGLVSLIGAALIIGSLVLAPAIVMGYAVRSAHREDHELGRLDGDA